MRLQYYTASGAFSLYRSSTTLLYALFLLFHCGFYLVLVMIFRGCFGQVLFDTKMWH